MRPFTRYALTLSVPAGIDMFGNAVFSILTREPGYFFWTQAYDGIFLIGLNIALARHFVWRPVGALLDGDDSEANRAALNRLASRSAIWIGLFFILLHPIGFFLSPIAGTYGGDFALPLDYVYFISTVISATSAYLVFYLTSGQVTQIKLDLFRRNGVIIPAAGARIRNRIVMAVGLIAIMPLLILAMELFWFTRYRDQGLDLPLEDALLIDFIVSGVLIVLTLTFLPRTITRPIELLNTAVERVAAGDLSTRSPVTSDDEIGLVTTRFNAMVEGLAERQAIRETFGKYVPEAVAERLIRDPSVTEGEERTATILFTDISGFTGISERLTPAQTIAMLNDYFEVVLEPIQSRHGTVNAFIGDAVFASFNVPVPDTDHAATAIAAALEIQERLKDRLFGPDRDIRLETRIGINTGPVAAGAVGAGGRLGYTILGDAVNIAARLEALVKERGGPVLVSGETMRAAGGRFRFEKVGDETMRGRAHTTEVWRVGGASG
ncbi:MAG: adenylate/guanylate cyclase domain-containing protein [Minwuia sp.]|uniref:adenylate/guanylate cyclase domain-containing protein n=1 Tax=Minwuia sp. TaxID=2493630 RepID=UPI003A8BE8C6